MQMINKAKEIVKADLDHIFWDVSVLFISIPHSLDPITLLSYSICVFFILKMEVRKYSIIRRLLLIAMLLYSWIYPIRTTLKVTTVLQHLLLSLWFLELKHFSETRMRDNLELLAIAFIFQQSVINRLDPRTQINGVLYSEQVIILALGFLIAQLGAQTIKSFVIRRAEIFLFTTLLLEIAFITKHSFLIPILQEVVDDLPRCIGVGAVIISVSLMSYFLAKYKYLKITYTRKIYHFLSFAVFIYLEKHNYRLMIAGFGLVLPILVVIEVIRYSYSGKSDLIRGLGDFFTAHAAEHEKGYIASHIYLLIGCLWPFTTPLAHHETRHCVKYVGLAVLGVGDSAAAIFGSKFGSSNRIYNGKSIVGFLSFTISFFIFYMYVGTMPPIYALITALFGAFIEILCKAADNVVLPALVLKYMEIFPIPQ